MSGFASLRVSVIPRVASVSVARTKLGLEQRQARSNDNWVCAWWVEEGSG